MGMMVDGRWTSDDGERTQDGRFVRRDSALRNWITPDGAPGPSGSGSFKAEPGRYHLYVAYACPWAHRTLIMRALEGLESLISVSVVHWRMGENGWTFEDAPGVIPDPVFNARALWQVYAGAQAQYTGRVTVPVLFDLRTRAIVNNESSEIIRMFDSAFDACGARGGDHYPPAHRKEIDAINARVYATLNNGVYRAGFAGTQSAYEEAVFPLFETLDWLEERLRDRRYLMGAHLSEADVRLVPTLLRFDAVYVGHFKCNLRRIVDYPNLWAYTRDVLQGAGVRETFHLDHCKRHYYESHLHINPTGIVPAGPLLDFEAPHGREALGD